MDSQEANIYIAALVIVLLLGAFITYFVVSVVRQQKRIIALQKSQIMIEIAAMEKDRARIARDLHDELGPQLSIVKFRIDYVHDSDGKDQQQLKESSVQLDMILLRLREIAQGLVSSTLMRKGLIIAIEEHLASIEEAGRMKTHFDFPTDLQLPDEVSIHVYRALLELIQNCMKHANAENIFIKINEEGTSLHISYEDDGKGFDPTRIEQFTGLGLRNLKNRIEILGGKVQFDSSPGAGSIFIIEIPRKSFI
jgi:signal transduction histidine kinase